MHRPAACSGASVVGISKIKVSFRIDKMAVAGVLDF